MARILRFLKKMIFSRVVILAILLVLQIYLLISSFYWLSAYWSKLSVLFSLLSMALVIYIINSDKNPAFKLTWVLFFSVFPVLGAPLYMFIEGNVTTIGIRKQIKRREEESAVFLTQDNDVRTALTEKPCSMTAISTYMEHAGHYPTYKNTQVTYFELGEKMYEDLMIELQKAKQYIFLEYFIISHGKMWDSVFELLKEKVAAGVEVKLLVDGTCMLFNLPRGFIHGLKEVGIEARIFMPVRPILSTHQNNRDHRKILVIDGKVAYNGGINLADEYINEKKLYGHWKDTAVKLQGDAVRSFTIMFLQFWYVAGTKNKWKNFVPGEYEKYLPIERQEVEAEGFVMPYADGPHSGHNLAENVYLDIMQRANKYIHIMSPYFINDHEIIEAFKYAAQRGTEVVLILPHIPDKVFAFNVARTFYPVLLKAGVKIYEYTPGFVHAKVFVSDNNKAVIGSVNLDFRSLYHHFECGTYFYRNQAVLDVERDFQETLQQCQQVTMEYYKGIPWYHRMQGHLLKLVAPLL